MTKIISGHQQLLMIAIFLANCTLADKFLAICFARFADFSRIKQHLCQFDKLLPKS